MDNIVSSQTPAPSLRESFHKFGLKVAEIIKKIAVVATYFFIALMHFLEAPIAVLTGNIRRAELNLTCSKIAFFCLYTFFLPKHHHLSSRFDFHHMSYGLLTILLPGRFERFGKWITACSLINYDHVGVFGYNEGKFFARDADGHYSLRPNGSAIMTESGERYVEKSDGTLEQIADVTIYDGDNIISEKAFPADNYLVRHARKITSELFLFWKNSPYLDAATEEKDRIISQVVKPELKKIAADDDRHQMPIHIDFDLFKD